jgi:hypothetical protein
MSGAQSLNAVSQIPWQLHCGLRAYCTNRDSCRCLDQGGKGISSSEGLLSGANARTSQISRQNAPP